MSTRFTWLLGVLALLAIGFLMACGSHYSPSSDGLIVVPSGGSAVLQSFSFNLSNGHVAAINHPPAVPGLPSSILLDPAGAFAYLIVSQNSAISGSQTGIATFKVNSNGTLSAIGIRTLNNAGSTPVVPVALAMDSAAKFLFVADSATVDSSSNPVSGAVSVLSIASEASLSEVSGSPFLLPVETGGVTPNASAVAVTPTVFPSHNAACSGHPVPSSEFLYVSDATNNVVVAYAVDPSSGGLTLQPYFLTAAGIPAGSVPSGAAVDPCRRFLYVSNRSSNSVSAYAICPPNSSQCSDGSLSVISGSPYPALNGPGPLAIDPLANFLYVVDTDSNQISSYKISQALGTLTAISQTISTGSTPVGIAIRGDDNWLFVANSGSANVSQFAITPATGVLTPAGVGVTTDSLPSGVAVK